jgi:uncharacterized repeat protein (TIGR02543 family)
MGYVGFTTSKAGKAIQIQSIANSPTGDLLVFVQNAGDGVVKLDSTGAAVVYIDGILMPCTVDPADGVLEEGRTATLTVAGAAVLPDEKVTVKVQTLGGAFMEKTTFEGEGPGGPGPGYTLTMNIAGAGSVTENPDKASYSPGEVVTLTAAPDASSFTGWSGDLGGSTNPETITMDGDKTVTATFNRYRKTITIQETQIPGSTPLSNFPVLISRSGDTDLQARCRADGYDIYFTTDANGDLTTRLDHEIESFNKSTGTLAAWARIPSLSATTNTVLYMFYGATGISSPTENPTGVWDSNYQAVYHLKEDPSDTAPQIMDSTGNNRDGTSQGSMTSGDQVAGKVDGSLDFDNSNDYINCGDGFMEGISQMTVEAWTYKRDASGDDRIAAKTSSGNPGDSTYLWSLGVGGNIIRVRLLGTGPTYSFDGATITQNTWYHIAFTYDSANPGGQGLKIYRNGVATHTYSKAGAIVGATNDVLIAENAPPPGGANSRLWNGIIDEVRLSNTVRSTDWIQTEYNNMNNPGAFYAISGQETVPP